MPTVAVSSNRHAASPGASTRTSSDSGTAMLDHQYIGTAWSFGLTTRIATTSAGDPSGSQQSTW